MFKITPKKRVLFVRRYLPVLLALFGVFSYLTISLQAPKLAYASTADTVNFQARLQSNSGAIVPDGYYNVEFKLYDASTGGNLLWTEDYTSTSGAGGADARLEVKDGYLSTALGSINPFGTGINWSQQLYLTMNIGGTTTSVQGPSATHPTGWDGEMSPRLALTSTPYAFQAGQAAQASELSTTNSGNTSTLTIQGSSNGNQSFIIQDQGAAGTYDLLTTSQANNDYIQLQNSTPVAQAGAIDISGAVSAGSILTGSLDTAGNTGLAIGGANATGVSIGNTGADNLTTIYGSATVKSASYLNSTTAFQVQDASSQDVLDADTTNGRVAIDGSSPTATLEVQNTSANSTVLDVQDSNGFDNLTVNNSDKITLGKAPTGVVGNQVANSAGGGDYGLETAQKFTTSSLQSGPISSMSVYIHSGVTSNSPAYVGQLAIYADETSGCAQGSECPSTLIASSAQTALTGNAWNTMSISTTLSPSTTYWFAFWENDPTGSEEGLNSASSANLPFVFGSETFGASMPSTFPTLTFDSTGYEASIYATFANSGSQLTADPTSNTIQLGYDTGLNLQGTAAYVSNTQGQLDSEAFGNIASVTGPNAVAVGYSSSSAQGGTAVGDGSVAKTNAVAVGIGAQTEGGGAISVGYQSVAAAGSIAIGYGANANGSSSTYTGSIAIGMDSNTTAANQLVIGGTSSSGWDIQNAYFGSGATDSSPQSVVLHATGACTAAGGGCTGATTNGTGANIGIAGGVGTGTGDGGNINFEVAAAGTVSGSTANSLATVASISGVNGAATFQNSVNSTTAFQILQGGSGTPLLTANTTNMIITVAGTDSSYATLQLSNAHFESTQTTAPTIGTPATCGTSPSAAVTSGSTDSSGSLYIESGSGTQTATCTVVLTFHSAYGAPPKSVVLTPDNTLGGTLPTALIAPVVSAKASDGSSVTIELPSTTVASTEYGFDYWIVQ